ncbi:MAG: hypothetical protein JJ957_20115 [Pseudomonadales bacterium]|nr:hypothetical protein [Pseudomonadales bacterium]
MGLNKIQADKAVAIFTAIFLLSIVICIWFFAHPIIKNSEAHLKPILFALTLLFTFPILGILFHFMSYAVEKPRLIQRIERIKNLPELNRKASASLFVEVFDTLLVLLMVVLISGLIYWGTHDFTHIEHSISVSAGLISLFAIAMWANRNEPTFSSISKSITVTTIIGCFAIGLLFSLAALDGPVGVAEILAWLVPLMWVYLNLKDFMESLYPDRSNPGYWASSYRVLWRASDEILVKIRRNSSASQALAVVLSLSIFLLPSEFGFLIPPEVKDMFQTVWRELGYIEISNQHIG